MMKSIWTPELIASLSTLWDEGHPTMEIARRLGINKNQVIGKVHHLGLTPRPNYTGATMEQRRAFSRRPV
jgi:hypothetical protein